MEQLLTFWTIIGGYIPCIPKGDEQRYAKNYIMIYFTIWIPQPVLLGLSVFAAGAQCVTSAFGTMLRWMLRVF
jgi:hypothetical protein